MRTNNAILVGIEPVDRRAPLASGAHILDEGAVPVVTNDRGYVTSAAVSPTFGHAIGLALVANGRERIGERVVAHDPIRGSSTPVIIRDPVFYDPEGGRLRA